MQTTPYDDNNQEEQITIRQIADLFAWPIRGAMRWVRFVGIKPVPGRPGWYHKRRVLEHHECQPSLPIPTTILRFLEKNPEWLSDKGCREVREQRVMQKRTTVTACRFKPDMKYRTPKPLKGDRPAENIGFRPGPQASSLFEALSNDLAERKNPLIIKILATIDWFVRNPSSKASPYSNQCRRILGSDLLPKPIETKRINNPNVNYPRRVSIGLRADTNTRDMLGLMSRQLGWSMNAIINESIIAFDALVRGPAGAIPDFISYCRAILGSSEQGNLN